MNPQDWWELLEENWNHIIYTIPNRLGYSLEDLATVDLHSDSALLDGDLTILGALLRAKENKDHQLILTYLQAFWAAAPDKSWIHEIPGWFALCDLLSEGYILYEEEEIK